MSTQKELYLLRADEARRDAEAASLVNVKERCLRAEAAWLEMAARAARTDRMRVSAEKAKAAKLEAAPAE